MKPRTPWALVVMGAWIMGSVCMTVVATENFYTIDRLLAQSSNAAFAADVQKLGRPEARDLLRYLSSELNRLYFQLWNVAQLVLGALALWLIAGSEKQDPAYETRGAGSSATRRAGPFGPAGGVVVMLSIVVLMLAWLTPAIVSLGRSLDFVPRDPAPPGMSRFWTLHAAYTSLELLKLTLGFVVAYWIAREDTATRA